MNRTAGTALVVAVGLVTALALPGAALAAPAPATPSHDTTDLSPAPERPITGLIVRTRDGRPASADLVAAAATALGGAHPPSQRPLSGGKTLLGLGVGIPPASAWQAAAALSRRSDVLYAEPDLWVYPTDASPVTPTDPLFAQQWDLWDTSGAAGGYSTRVSGAWPLTTGSPSVVVAVLDTGLTAHPDLTASVTAPTASDPVVRGYDFVSGDGTGGVAPYLTANDGDGRDADPSDPGDFITAKQDAGTDPTTGTFFMGCGGENPDGSSNSSWHGTHVTGTIVAQHNGLGIAGMAPGVKVQPVRVLGRCGGHDSDIEDAITWASGGSVPGVPANATPASVVSLSLGGPGACLPSTQAAINGARARGTTVIVAAGNSGAPIAPTSATSTTTGDQPADCSGVIRVAASTRAGGLASYSDHGTSAYPITVAAPGGDAAATANDILSTVNPGLTTPVSAFPDGAADYAAYAGTSMATPHVAAAVALMQSRVSVRLSPDDVMARLQATATPWPAAAGCSAARCGAGIIDVSRALPTAPSAPPSVSTSSSHGAVYVAWERPAANGSRLSGYHVQAQIDGGAWQDVVASTGSPRLSARVTALADSTPLTSEHSYAFRVSGLNGVGEGPATASSAVSPAAAGTPSEPDQPTAPTVFGGASRLIVSWSPPADGGAPLTAYSVRYHQVAADGTPLGWTCLAGEPPPCGADTTATSAIIDLPGAVGSFEVEVAALSSSGASVFSEPTSSTLAPLDESMSVSSTTLRPFKDGFQDSVTVRARTNRTGGSGTGLVRILNSRLAPVLRVPLRPASSWTYVWRGTSASGHRLSNGRYYVEVWLQGSHDVLHVVRRTSVLIKSSQALTPVVTLSSTRLFPFRDGYRDSIRVTSTATVPSVMTWKVVSGRTVLWSTTWKRRATVSAAYTGVRAKRGLLGAGTYALVVYAQGGEGRTVAKVVAFTVSSRRLVRIPFRIPLTATIASRYRYTSPGATELPVADRPAKGQVQIPQQSAVTFLATLPASTLPVSSVRVTVVTASITGRAVTRAGYYSGTPAAPVVLTVRTIGLGTVALPEAPGRALVGGQVRWFAANDDLSAAKGSSRWVITSFVVTGVRSVLA